MKSRVPFRGILTRRLLSKWGHEIQFLIMKGCTVWSEIIYCCMWTWLVLAMIFWSSLSPCFKFMLILSGKESLMEESHKFNSSTLRITFFWSWQKRASWKRKTQNPGKTSTKRLRWSSSILTSSRKSCLCKISKTSWLVWVKIHWSLDFVMC